MMRVSQLFDHHMHSILSEDSEQSFEELVQDAIKKGKKFITVTDHSDIIYASTTGSFCADISAYDAEVIRLHALYPEIKILRGTEVGFEKSIVDDVNAFLDKHQFDIRVVSIHSIFGGVDFANEYRKKGKWTHSEDVVHDYFLATLDAVKMVDTIQILGHIDYLFRYIPNGTDFDVSPYQDILFEIFEVMIRKDIALDLNTAGIRYGLPFFHPQPKILELYKSAGGSRLALGSDAHKVSDVNFGFSRVLDELEGLGFTEITTFETGKPNQIKIASIKR